MMNEYDTTGSDMVIDNRLGRCSGMAVFKQLASLWNQAAGVDWFFLGELKTLVGRLVCVVCRASVKMKFVPGLYLLV